MIHFFCFNSYFNLTRKDVFLFSIILLVHISITYSQVKTEKLRKILEPYFITIEEYQVVDSIDQQKILLGKKLFFDKKLSKHKQVSCNTCHQINFYGTSKRNSYRDIPSIYNTTYLEIFNTDGTSTSLNKKLIQSFISDHEMGNTTIEDLVLNMKENVTYTKQFKAIYNTGITIENIIGSIISYLKTLNTPAPIDAFIKGNNKVLSSQQIEGGLLFNEKNCYSCHTGGTIGGQMIQKVGIYKDWPNQKDQGYYHFTKNASYKMFFRVASLRNIEKTAPYFHDKSENDLIKAIQKMGYYERGIKITQEEAIKIKEFLKSFTGKLTRQ